VLSILPCILGNATPAAIQLPVLIQAGVFNAALLARLDPSVLPLPFYSLDCPLKPVRFRNGISIALRAIGCAELPSLSSRESPLAIKAIAEHNLASD
jgi:hypothetical protein